MKQLYNLGHETVVIKDQGYRGRKNYGETETVNTRGIYEDRRHPTGNGR
jgi:hypothetical protein